MILLNNILLSTISVYPPIGNFLLFISTSRLFRSARFFRTALNSKVTNEMYENQQ